MAKADEQLYSISQLHELTGLDRSTIKKRLEGVEPQGGPKNAKTYSLKVALRAFIKGASTAYDEAELRKMQAEARLKEHKLEVEEGRYVAVSDVESERVKEVQWLNSRLTRLPREMAAQLFKSDSPEQLEDVLRHQLGVVLNEWREL